MNSIPDTLTALVAQAAAAAGHGDSPVPMEPVVPSRNPQHGDYQSNYAFRLGKALRTNPRAVAQAIADALPAHPAVASVEVAGPGFLNFRVGAAWLADHLAEMCADERLGVAQRDGVVVIDYSSPNVAKRMHIGHLRSTVIGNALDRVHRWAGYQVVADNHIGDWGTQFGKLIVAWGEWVDEAAFASDPIAELERIYQKYAVEEKGDPSLLERARAETVKLQSGDPRNRALWQRFVSSSLEEYQALYDRLDVSFDETLGESAYHEQMVSLVEELLESGAAEISRGAAIIPFTASDGKGLGKTPLIIRKSDGAFAYGSSDMACVRYRLDRWSPARVLYVVGVPQQLHFRQVFAACQKLGWTQPSQLTHVRFGTIKLPGGAKFSSREGNVIHLVDLLDAAVERARAVVDGASAELPEAERAAIAEAVGVGAVRYADLSQNPQTDVIFEWDRMLALNGNTAPFMMYSYARCRNIQRKGGIEDPQVGAPTLDEPAERALALALARFPQAVEAVLETCRPNMLCDYMFGLAQSLNRFYHDCTVLHADDEATRASRLHLVEAAARVLGAGLRLLGLTPLARM